ncbi:aspartate kinase [Imbroritus primus]|uniref:Aspartate kinase n=1 Tax=Imbroritus primus TaxID=3058603 RepID=A0ACD3SN59_9BURK|nr:aspartate kinase [Burkholderiaceae bacterium PBA]
MWVVKIGGSLGRDPLLREWLKLLSEQGGGRVVVVPGGGGFADQVRDYQTQWRFNDLVAHNMAVLAMVQYAMMMQGLCPDECPGLSLAVDDESVRKVLRNAGVALWAPFPLLREAADEMTNWDVTSDSIAAWLSNRLNAERLILVKSSPLVSSMRLGTPIEAYADREIVDPSFMRFTADVPYPVDVLHKGDLATMRELLAPTAAGCLHACSMAGDTTAQR